MAFVENRAAFMADFGLKCVFGSLSATVLLDIVTEDVLSGRAASDKYQMRYWTSDLPGLTFQSAVTVDGNSYTVLNTKRESDGMTSCAQLEAL